jgi:hypothetical protein
VFGRPKRCADSSSAPREARWDEEKKKSRGGVFRLQPVGTFHGSSLEQFRVSSYSSLLVGLKYRLEAPAADDKFTCEQGFGSRQLGARILQRTNLLLQASVLQGGVVNVNKEPSSFVRNTCRVNKYLEEHSALGTRKVKPEKKSVISLDRYGFCITVLSPSFQHHLLIFACIHIVT